MLSVIMVVVVVISSIWVYLDATKNKIGHVPYEKYIQIYN